MVIQIYGTNNNCALCSTWHIEVMTGLPVEAPLAMLLKDHVHKSRMLSAGLLPQAGYAGSCAQSACEYQPPYWLPHWEDVPLN